MQLAIDGLIALVVVVSHLVISARLAYLDVFNYRYIPYVEKKSIFVLSLLLYSGL